MATGSTKTLPRTLLAAVVNSEIGRVLHSGLADFSLRELLGMLISSAGVSERKVYFGTEPPG
jgi:hypothetical protein